MLEEGGCTGAEGLAGEGDEISDGLAAVGEEERDLDARGKGVSQVIPSGSQAEAWERVRQVKGGD